ncbi:MAG: class I SAM-dependent methyltransferase [Acidimicrobiales bacterium]
MPSPVKANLRRAVLRRRGRSTARPFVHQAATWVGGLEGRRVLEVGSDQGGRNLSAVAEMGAEEVVGVNPAMDPAELARNVRLLAEDAGQLPFDDGYFDVVLTDSVFEHVHDLPGVLDELYRVVKPGGQILAQYGPIWSTPYGHHLWVHCEGQLWSYWNVVLPAWCHLVDEPADLHRHCTERLNLSTDVANAVVQWVYEDSGQNRLLFSDYVRIVSECAWTTRWYKGYDYPELAVRYRSQPDIALRHAEVTERWPHCQSWLYDGVMMLLSRG